MVLATTLNRLRAANACTERYQHLLKALGGPSFDHDAPINLLSILEHNGVELEEVDVVHRGSCGNLRDHGHQTFAEQSAGDDAARAMQPTRPRFLAPLGVKEIGGDEENHALAVDETEGGGKICTFAKVPELHFDRDRVQNPDDIGDSVVRDDSDGLQSRHFITRGFVEVRPNALT